MNILVCLGHSTEAARAVESVALSGFLDNKFVCLLHVGNSQAAEEYDFGLLRNMESRIRALCSPRKIDKLLSFDTRTADAILEKATLTNASLIVVGARAQSGLERMLLGSVSQALIAKSKIPVLISRDSSTVGSGKLLLALDDCAASSSLLSWLSNEPWCINKEIILLSVIERLSSSFYSETNVAAAAEQLAKHDWQESSRTKLLSAWSALLSGILTRELIPSTVSEGSAQELILKAASHWGAEFVVVGATKKTRSDRLVLGSVSQAIAVNAPGSVLIVPESVPDVFETVRQSTHACDELANLLAEEPHPMPTHTPITGTDTNGFMAYW